MPLASCQLPPMPVVCPIKLLLLPQRCRFDLRLLDVFLYLFYIFLLQVYICYIFFLLVISTLKIFMLPEEESRSFISSRLGICMPLHSFD